jgi:hypothetical protein
MKRCRYAHLVVEDLGLARLGLGDERVVEDVEDILADLLELRLDLLAVVADGAEVLLRALGVLLLLDGRNDAPRRASGTDNVLVGDGQQVALVHGELTGDLSCVSRALMGAWRGRRLLVWERMRSGIPWRLPAKQSVCELERAVLAEQLTFMYVTISAHDC